MGYPCDFSQHTSNLNSIIQQCKNLTFSLISFVKKKTNSVYVKKQQASESRICSENISREKKIL